MSAIICSFIVVLNPALNKRMRIFLFSCIFLFGLHLLIRGGSLYMFMGSKPICMFIFLMSSPHQTIFSLETVLPVAKTSCTFALHLCTKAQMVFFF